MQTHKTNGILTSGVGQDIGYIGGREWPMRWFQLTRGFRRDIAKDRLEIRELPSILFIFGVPDLP